VTPEEDDAVSAVSELEAREWLEEQGAGAEEPDAGGGNRHCSYQHPTSWRPREWHEGPDREVLSFSLFSLFSIFPFVFTLAFLSFVISLVRVTSSWDRPGRRQKGCLQRAATARTADRKRTVHNLAMISIGRTRVMNKQNKKSIKKAAVTKGSLQRAATVQTAGGKNG
jgi:hypothetical protein